MTVSKRVRDITVFRSLRQAHKPSLNECRILRPIHGYLTECRHRASDATGYARAKAAGHGDKMPKQTSFACALRKVLASSQLEDRALEMQS